METIKAHKKPVTCLELLPVEIIQSILKIIEKIVREKNYMDKKEEKMRAEENKETGRPKKRWKSRVLCKRT